MNKLFEQLARGEMPNFIEMMIAIGEISDSLPGTVCLDCRIDQDSDLALEDTPESIC